MNKATRWIKIDGKEMMKEQHKEFLKFLQKFNVDYITYYDEHKPTNLIMKLSLTNEIIFDKNHEFWKGFGEWSYYAPITNLSKEPKVSDCNIIEDMSIDPYDIDKWRNT